MVVRNITHKHTYTHTSTYVHAYSQRQDLTYSIHWKNSHLKLKIYIVLLLQIIHCRFPHELEHFMVIHSQCTIFFGRAICFWFSLYINGRFVILISKDSQVLLSYFSPILEHFYLKSSFTPFTCECGWAVEAALRMEFRCEWLEHPVLSLATWGIICDGNIFTVKYNFDNIMHSLSLYIVFKCHWLSSYFLPLRWEGWEAKHLFALIEPYK